MLASVVIQGVDHATVIVDNWDSQNPKNSWGEDAILPLNICICHGKHQVKISYMVYSLHAPDYQTEGSNCKKDQRHYYQPKLFASIAGSCAEKEWFFYFIRYTTNWMAQVHCQLPHSWHQNISYTDGQEEFYVIQSVNSAIKHLWIFSVFPYCLLVWFSIDRLAFRFILILM
jgi:hypothetical protein